MEKWAGKPLEPIILDEAEIFCFFLKGPYRHRFTPGDTGARKARLDWDRAKAFVERVKRQAEPDVHIFYMEVLYGGIRIGGGSGRRSIGLQIRHPLLGEDGRFQL
ncbi:hypothetical protein PLACP1_04460 [Planifilum fimeticola]